MVWKRSRTEDRTRVRLHVQLCRSDAPNLREMATALDISPHGARIETVLPWEPGTNILVKALRDSFEAQARVMYCSRQDSDNFILGIEILHHVKGRWVA